MTNIPPCGFPTELAARSLTSIISLSVIISTAAHQVNGYTAAIDNDIDNSIVASISEDVAPWHMTTLDDINLQIGWLLIYILFVLSFYCLQRWWPYRLCRPQPTADAEHRSVSKFFYALLWGPGKGCLCTKSMVIGMGLVNFCIFAFGTEAQINGDSFGQWISQAAFVFELSSLFISLLILAARLTAAGAHPVWSKYGSGAWWRYLLGDFFVHVDILAMLVSFLWLSRRDWHFNLLWFSLIRAFEMAGSTSEHRVAWPGLQTMWNLIDDERELLTAMCLYAFIPWFLFSGLYFVANNHRESTAWDAAEYQGKPWQRFVSIPSSLFYVMINLGGENPLADGFHTFFSRFVVVLVFVLGVPLFGLPTGVLGASLMKLANDDQQSEISHGATDVTEPQSSQGDARTHILDRVDNSVISVLVTAALSFGSVGMYFYKTAGETSLLFVNFHVSLFFLIVVDGTVSLVFAMEWACRMAFGGTDYARSLTGTVDLVSWVPGILHVSLYFGGQSTGDWLAAACVLRVFKLERYMYAFHDLFDILKQRSEILKATGLITFFIWISFSSLLYFTERFSTDQDVRDNYASVARALWSEFINLHGEWVWCDYSPVGKALCTVIAMCSIGISIVPIIIFSEGYQKKMQEIRTCPCVHLGSTSSSLDSLPWQSRYLPSQPGIRRRLYDLLYSHLKPRPQQYNTSYLTMCVASLLLTVLTSMSTVTLTLQRFSGHTCDLAEACTYAGLMNVSRRAATYSWFLYALDVVATLFFAAEFGMRIGAIGWRHVCSFVGVCDILSQLAFIVTLTPFRQAAFFPDYAKSSVILDDMMVPLRLLRLFMLESYVASRHMLSQVIYLNRIPLIRSGYALLCTWYVFGTMLYLFEHDGPKGGGEVSMADRYADVLTGLQYALVHLTGDYPVTDYTLPSKIVHFFAVIFGMCVIAAFTGIFSAGFVSYLEQQRSLERVSRPAVILGRMPTWRSSSSSASSAHSSRIRRLATSLLDDTRTRGWLFTRFTNVALLLNLVGTLIDTIPETDDFVVVDLALEVNEICTGSIFIIEYVLLLAAEDSICKAFWRRLVDLCCLFPTFARALNFFNCLHGHWRGKDGWENVVLCCAIFRVVRILNFPCIRKQRRRIGNAIQRSLVNLAAPSVLAFTIWITMASLWVWVENIYSGPEKEHMTTIPHALYWTAIYFVGEWANVDFSPGAGSRLCIVMCLFGVAVFAIPTGLVMDAVSNTMMELAEEHKQLRMSSPRGGASPTRTGAVGGDPEASAASQP